MSARIFQRGEVYWVHFPEATGGEIRKTRPAVVVSNDRANLHLNRVQIVPLTSNVRRIFAGESLVRIAGVSNKALATQITTVTKQRVRDLVGQLTTNEMRQLDRAIRIQLGLIDT